MQDKAGTELEVDDLVLYIESSKNTSHLEWGRIVKFTPAFVVLEVKSKWAATGVRVRRCPPDRVVKPMRGAAHAG